MGRRTVVALSSLNVINPYYLEVKTAIDVLQGAETAFYEARAAELNTYPGLTGLDRDVVESAYDALLGSEPWTYTARFNASANPSRDPTTTFGGGATINVTVPDSVYLRVTGELPGDFSTSQIEYVVGAGEPAVDILYTDISFFKEAHFTEVPTAYVINTFYTGRQAHQYRLIGSLYDASAVASAYSSYLGVLNSYEEWDGTTVDDFFGGTGPTPWDGFTGDVDAGYNRPQKLSAKLIRETRGAN